MILYLDTSAVVKLYFQEACSNEVRAAVESVPLVVTSRLAYVETLSGVARNVREGYLGEAEQEQVMAAFVRDWKRFFVIEVSDAVCQAAAKLTWEHPLRSIDAIHLASALFAATRMEEETAFCAFDRRLSQAALAEGLLWPEGIQPNQNQSWSR